MIISYILHLTSYNQKAQTRPVKSSDVDFQMFGKYHSIASIFVSFRFIFIEFQNNQSFRCRVISESDKIIVERLPYKSFLGSFPNISNHRCMSRCLKTMIFRTGIMDSFPANLLSLYGDFDIRALYLPESVATSTSGVHLILRTILPPETVQ